MYSRIVNLRMAVSLFLIGASSLLFGNVQTDWTAVQLIELSQDTQVVTVKLDADISAECGALDITFPYSGTTLSRHYYITLIATKVSNLPIKVTYHNNGVACTLSALTVGPAV